MIDYFDRVGDAIAFIIALGSILGLLGLIFGVLILLFSRSHGRIRYSMPIIIISGLLLLICGWSTGLRYFHIRI